MSAHDTVLHGREIYLDPVRHDDAEQLWQLTDRALWAGMTTPWPSTADAYADHIRAQQNTPGMLAFTVRDSTTGTVRGSTTFYDLNLSQRRVEIGSTWYGRAHWGGPTNPATKLLLLTHAFDTLDVNRVALRCDARNTRSANAIQRLGATREGTLRAHRIAADGSIGDTAYFSILNSEWPSIRDTLTARLHNR